MFSVPARWRAGRTLQKWILPVYGDAVKLAAELRLGWVRPFFRAATQGPLAPRGHLEHAMSWSSVGRPPSVGSLKQQILTALAERRPSALGRLFVPHAGDLEPELNRGLAIALPEKTGAPVGLPIFNCRLPIADCRLPIGDW